MQTPTIGRRLWYWPNDRERDARLRPNPVIVLDPRQACDAGVVFVHDPERVNLIVTDHAGNTHKREFVQLVQGEREPDQLGVAEWMPFQREQAKRQADSAAA